jgi:Strabismus protein.
VTGEDVLEYRVVVSYASSFVDALLFIHYITVVLIEIRHLQPAFYIKVSVLCQSFCLLVT